MDEKIYCEYVAILKEELQPAMGCTEPIAVAYCAALARRTLGALPETVEVLASANIIKNVKSVIVPNTNGQRGIAAAAAAGIVSGNADAQLQVLASLTPEQVDAVGAYLQQAAFTVRRADKDYVFDIQVRVTAGADSASVEIAGYHTNVIRIEKNGVVQFHKDYQESGSQHATDRSLLTVEHMPLQTRWTLPTCRRRSSGRSTITGPSPRRACAGITARTSAASCCSLTA